jgi:hypothetical protein
MKLNYRALLIAFSLALAAFALVTWAAPLVSQLDSEYTNQLDFVVVDQFRNSPEEAWVTASFNAQRSDQTISNSQGVNIIQSSLNWYNEAGDLIFLSSGIYGVDQRTRANVIGYGDVQRNGQFLFPTRLQPGTYIFWDCMYIGPRQATFERAEMLNGIPVLVFSFIVNALNETSGYSYLPLVPERYLAHTNGTGLLWIEPLSGLIVKYEEKGVSYFVEPASGKKMEDFHIWSDGYTPASQAAQLKLAADLRLRTLLVETWLPGGLLVLALFWLAQALRRKRPTTSAAAALDIPAGHDHSLETREDMGSQWKI